MIEPRRRQGLAVLLVALTSLFALSAQVDIGVSQFFNGAGKARGAVAGVNGIVASGAVGVPVVVASGRTVGAVAAVASVSTYTVGASDASFEISANVDVTTATTHNFTVTCAYTNEANVSQTLTLGFTQLSGATFLTAITNITGANSYESIVYHIRAKAGTSITIATAAGGTYTSVVYNAEGLIRQMS